MRVALFLEWTGVLHGAFVLAFIHKKLAKFQRDEVYIGTAEERAAAMHADESEIVAPRAGKIYACTSTGENPIEAPETFEEIEAAEADLRRQLAILASKKAQLKRPKHESPESTDNENDVEQVA